MKALLQSAWRENLGLRVAMVFNAFLLVFALVALPLDHRVLLGLNPWIKPLKFDISVMVYALTVGAVLSALGRSASMLRMRWVIGWGIGMAMILENGIISLQSLRGVRSHMNFATVQDAVLFGVMGLFITLNTVLVAWLTVLVCATEMAWPRPAAWGLRLGLVVFLAGSLEGVYMVARFQAHTVGARDGGPGLPFVNWSTGHGDLRVAHFFALHALQLLPLLGWALSRTQLPRRAQLAGVLAGSAVYLVAVWALFRQAMAGLPLLG